ncbi:hypothetical protein EVAR_65452_1 [Eumeta japonica]|uniref:Uncharacterized protein n=1 Tax=Eumeta variegata TaxID=151549 RepID=A0A4C2A4A0_EUMVA|nr:hypothetical protein EVAR_65452_1 [Eumeta japonica]
MGLISAIVVGAVGGLSLATGIGPAVVAPLLGFSSTGIVAGSVAASAQSYYGSVSAGSVISALTSIAMTPTPIEAGTRQRLTSSTDTKEGLHSIPTPAESQSLAVCIRYAKCVCFQQTSEKGDSILAAVSYPFFKLKWVPRAEKEYVKELFIAELRRFKQEDFQSAHPQTSTLKKKQKSDMATDVRRAMMLPAPTFPKNDCALAARLPATIPVAENPKRPATAPTPTPVNSAKPPRPHTAIAASNPISL